MTTEREQLTLAAKACGIRYSIADMCWYLSDGSFVNPWNPLTDDGDCARMEAKLGICIDWCHEIVFSCACIDEEAGTFVNGDEKYADHNGDKSAARRAASVAVAAEIGRLK